MNQPEVLQNAVRPPGDEARVLIRTNPGKKPGAIPVYFGGTEFVEEGQFQAIGQKALSFQTSEEFLHVRAGDHNDNGRLHFRARLVQKLEAPDNLGEGQGRELFELKLDHGASLGKIGLGQLNDAEKHVLGREPRDIQFGLKESLPVLADKTLRERVIEGARFLPQQVELAGRKLPD